MRRALPSIASQSGEFARVYVSWDVEEKVDAENTKEKGCPILATGGTCEFMGKEMPGTAVASPTRRDAIVSWIQDGDMTALQEKTTP